MGHLDEFDKDFIESVSEKFDIIEEIGSGAMGVVLKAHEKFLQRTVAIKVLHSFSNKLRPELIQRFENEARCIAKLGHKNIVTIFDFGIANKTRYIVEQYLPGKSLDDKLENEKKLSQQEAVIITKQILEGLSYAHDNDIVHRDLKPSNILFDQHGEAIITDFGIARMTTVDTKLTQTGEYMGTPEFISPEQAQGKTVDAQSDIYSVGVMLYYMVTGRLPFQADNALAIAYKHVYEQPISPSEYAEVDLHLEHAILRAMKKDKNDRYTSAKEFIDDLNLSYNSNSNLFKTVASTAVTRKRKKRKNGAIPKKIKLIFSAAVVIIALIALIFVIEHYRTPQGEHLARRVVVTASSQDRDRGNITYDPELTLDDDRATAWAEGAPGPGIGEYLLYSFRSPFHVTRIGIIPGYDKVENDQYGDRWYKNYRLKTATLIFSDNTDTTVELRDSRVKQFFRINRNTSFVKMVIKDVHPTERWEETCISGVEIWGLAIEQ